MPVIPALERWYQEGSRVQGHLHLHRKFKASLCCVNHLKEKEEEDKEGGWTLEDVSMAKSIYYSS